MKLGTKNTVSLSANSSSCEQPTDNKTGLMYQEVKCNSRNGLLLKIALCADQGDNFEVFVNTGSPPTVDSYLYKAKLTQKINGYFKLKLSRKSFQMPAPGSNTKCIIGIRPVPSRCFCLFDNGPDLQLLFSISIFVNPFENRYMALSFQ